MWQADGCDQHQDVVVRIRPPAPGLLEPYDLQRQFVVLRALEATPVRAPRALWIDETGEVLGRPFYVMERLGGAVYERDIPSDPAESPDRIYRMSESVIEQIATIHLVDLQATGLHAIDDGTDFLERELHDWESEMHRVQRGPLPALERLVTALRAQRPEPTRIILVHGDTKGGNFAFCDDQVSGVFDWEMAAIGDPMADIGWAEVTWSVTPPFSLLSDDDLARLLVHYEDRTGISVHHRAWYRSFQAFKMAVIMLVGAMLVDRGFSQDRRLAEMGAVVPFITNMGLRDLGIDEQIDSGPVTARSTSLRSSTS